MLAYTALRLAAIEALAGATIADDKVYDSRKFPLDAVDETLIDDGPSLCVYTEEGDGDPFGTGRIHPNDVRVWLVVEAAIIAKGTFEVVRPVTDADGTPVVDDSGNVVTATTYVDGGYLAERDQLHEGMLDLLVGQVRRRLSIDAIVDRDPAADLFRFVRRGIIKSTDEPQRSGDKATPLAGRTLRYHVALKSADSWREGATLPEPLATVAARVVKPSSLDLVARLAGLAPSPPSPVTATAATFHLEVGVGRSPVPTADVVAESP